jgi:hypothetical protein
MIVRRAAQVCECPVCGSNPSAKGELPGEVPRLRSAAHIDGPLFGSGIHAGASTRQLNRGFSCKPPLMTAIGAYGAAAPNMLLSTRLQQ